MIVVKKLAQCQAVIDCVKITIELVLIKMIRNICGINFKIFINSVYVTMGIFQHCWSRGFHIYVTLITLIFTSSF